MKTFGLALVIALVLESLCFALLPGFMRKAMREAATKSDLELRTVGATGLVLAVLLAFLIKSFS